MSKRVLSEVERLRLALYNAQLTLENIAIDERAEGRNSLVAARATREAEAIRAVLRVGTEGDSK